jgi:hypothetical protein
MDEYDRAEGHRVLADTLRNSLESLRVRVLFTDVSVMSPRDVAAAGRAASLVNVQVWIDLTVRGQATVYVTEGQNVFRRRLELGGGALGPVGLDLIDVVVTDSVRSVLSGRSVGVTREEFTRAFDPSEPGTGPANATLSGTNAQSTDTRVSGTGTGSTGTGSGAAGGPAPLRAWSGAVSPQQPAPRDSPPFPAIPSPRSADSVPDTVRVVPDTVPGDTGRRGVVPGGAEHRRGAEEGRWGGLLTADYEAALLGASRIVHGPRICVAVDRNPFRLSLAVGGRLPDAVQIAGGATVHFESLTLRASAAFLVALSQRSSLVGSLGAGVDLGRVRPTSDQIDITPATPFWTLDTILRPALGFEHRRGTLVAGVTLALDLDLRGARYVVDTPATPHPIVTPFRVRPVALLSLGAAF